MGSNVDHEQALGTDSQMLVIKWNKVNDRLGLKDMTSYEQFIYRNLTKLSILLDLIAGGRHVPCIKYYKK